jgi:hypothetical protein
MDLRYMYWYIHVYAYRCSTPQQGAAGAVEALDGLG